MGYTGPLADKDRIFTNVYGFQSPYLKAARQRGDWDETANAHHSGGQRPRHGDTRARSAPAPRG